MIGAIHTKSLVQRFDQGLRDRDALFGQPLFYKHRQKRFFRDKALLTDVAHRRGKDKVAAQWHRRIELFRVKPVNGLIQPFVFEALCDLFAQFDNAAGQFRIFVWIHARVEHAVENQICGAKGLGNFQPELVDVIG